MILSDATNSEHLQMTGKTMHIGIDDTDSPRQGCTTHVAALLVEILTRLEVEFFDYPNLVRLNPNAPWKTRGNGALCLRIRYDGNCEDKIEEIVTDTVEKHADLDYEGTDPGIVFFKEAEIPRQIRSFAEKAITGIVNLKDALELLKHYKAEAASYKKGRGIIGSLAAVGENLECDHTFEILAYRTSKKIGLKREVERSSIIEMDKATAPYTFNNIDQETGRVLITPRGPDPILFGIRGETAEVVKKAFDMVKTCEPVERWVIFRTNQGTDAHLRRFRMLSQIRPYNPLIAQGTVAVNPKIIPRRHVVFSIKDESAQVDCAAYEPTGHLRKIAKKLVKEDYVEVFGSVRASSENLPVTINMEKIQVLTLKEKVVLQNPVCPTCGKRLKSMGKEKGFKCKKCHLKYTKLKKAKVRMDRGLKKGLYMTSPRSQRHLTKPIRRYGMEKHHKLTGRLIDQWHFP